MTTISFRTENAEAERLCAILTAYGVQDLEIDFEHESGVSQKELKAIERGREQVKNGEVTPSDIVRKKALEICMK
ncbi:MAG: hypothetical protein KGV44_13445 [Flavobacteriaceae bacterium]|nr:hypothetical protein [Flavobacteriaceae bacterium]